MSRIGKKPIPVPKNVEVKVTGNHVAVKGPKGKLEDNFNTFVTIKFEKEHDHIVVAPIEDNAQGSAMQGLWRALVNNMIIGVTEGYSKSLEIVGTGYRAEVKGKKVIINIGFTHPVEFTMPDGITVATPTPLEIVLTSCDKHALGQLAANIRAVRPPEPYKGKGIRYKGEYVRRLVGKSFGSTAAK
ncbi:MAG: 50S ribosomal protein L6 [Candidatus Brocadiia bacterium]